MRKAERNFHHLIHSHTLPFPPPLLFPQVQRLERLVTQKVHHGTRMQSWPTHHPVPRPFLTTQWTWRHSLWGLSELHPHMPPSFESALFFEIQTPHTLKGTLMTSIHFYLCSLFLFTTVHLFLWTAPVPVCLTFELISSSLHNFPQIHLLLGNNASINQSIVNNFC